MAVQAQNNLPSVLAMPASASSSLFFHCYSKEFLVCSRQTFANDIVLMPLLLHSNLDGRRHCFRYYVEKLNCRWIFHFWLYPIIFKNYLYYLFLQILDLLAVACIASLIFDRDKIWLSTRWVYFNNCFLFLFRILHGSSQMSLLNQKSGQKQVLWNFGNSHRFAAFRTVRISF